jgi:geranylgeranyl transferase type-2 subunit beta
LPIVDFVSLIYGAALLHLAAEQDIFAMQPAGWQANVAARLELFRRPDGGYAKTDEGQSSSTYHTFLVVLCLQLLEQPVPQPERIVDFVNSRHRDEGGFVEIGPMRRGGTNPTAAAVALLQIFGALDEPRREETIDFLAELQNDEGGLLANSRIPIADLLSSFTGFLTLVDLQARDEIEVDRLRRFVQSVEQPDGGFFAAAWDTAADVEYTFYGLGCLALLA